MIDHSAAIGVMPLDMPESVLIRFKGRMQDGITLRDPVTPKAADAYRYMNFDQIKVFVEVVAAVEMQVAKIARFCWPKASRRKKLGGHCVFAARMEGAMDYLVSKQSIPEFRKFYRQ